MDEPTTNYFPEFNDDCYAECEEHFTIIRRDLLLLEKYIDKDKVDKPLLDELFRSFHTLKGLTGMIGQRDGEKLSHVMENMLRHLTKNKDRITQPLINGFFEGVKMLESLIDSMKKNRKPPDLKPVIKRLTLLSNDQEISDANQPDEGRVEDSKNIPTEESFADSTSQSVNPNGYRIIFTPSPELYELGYNVNTVRAKLEEVGEITQSKPIIPEAGKVAFEFVVQTTLELPEIEEQLGGFTSITPEEQPVAAEAYPSADDILVPASDRTFSLTNVVRVDLNRLDELMKMVGDLVISRARLDDLLKSLEKELPIQKFRLIQETAIHFERQVKALREGVVRVRLIPIGELFERMQFVIRDMIRESQNQIILNISGKATEIDKVVVEKMLDPLLHLVRNAVSHGIETSTERLKNGKSPEGHISLNAYTSGDSVVIELQDDGRGINRSVVLRKAVEMGLITPQEKLTDEALLELICSQGFSTREQADLNSGRGVGMAVVKKTIDELGGYLELETEQGKGTKFTIYLPLTLAIMDALILTAGDQKYAMPLPLVSEVLAVEYDAITILANNELIPYRNRVLPIVRLAHYFNLQQSATDKGHVLVIGTGQKAIGVLVDKVHTLREIVVRPLNDPLVQVPGVSGATELGDGKAILILDTPSLIKAVTMRKNITATQGRKTSHVINHKTL